MDKFLEMVAADLYRRMGGDLARTVVVFPGKRAKLYFDEYLAREAKVPMWAPTYTSIRELLCGMSDKEIGEPEKLICELHKVFRKECGKEEPLDDFYFWGEMLLGDFDDVDKSMADAKGLFSNLEELKEMDDLSFLTDEQAKAAKSFFRNFAKGERTELKENFRSVWNKLGNIYTAYRSLLASQGIAYEGMLYREAMESLDVSRLPYDKYVFVGFNVLTRVEHRLFSALQGADKAIFYWDYDTSYISKPNHEAATFLAQNIRDFPSPLAADRLNALSRPKTIQYVEASTENAQARYLSQWLPDNITKPERDTAVVLCNESLLPPVLHSLPASVGKVNITMGYPLLHTPAYSLLCAIMEAHTQGYDAGRGTYRLSRLKALLNHPFTHRLSPNAAAEYEELANRNIFYPTPERLRTDERMARLFTPAADKAELCALMSWTLEAVAATFRDIPQEVEKADPLLPIHKESLFIAYTIVSRFGALVADGDLASLKTSTFCSLMRRAMSAVRIPFHGEPAEGVQIMGVIETRNLDFRHVIMLSTNEGFMPRVANDVSFIPYNLRKAFGMTTIEHKISVYAYYFYRLIGRAETVTLLYNAVTDGKRKGEWSRFMLQLLVDTRHNISRFQLEAQQRPQEPRPIEVGKTPEVMEALRRRFDCGADERNILSPSALNVYLSCPLRFYFRYVADLKPREETDEEVDNAMFGTLFHKAAEDIYGQLTASGDSLITSERLRPFLTDGGRKVRECVDGAFAAEFFKSPAAPPRYNGQQLINKNVLARFLHILLETDSRNAPFTFAHAEKQERESMEITAGGERLTVSIGGTIDRVDIPGDGTLRIVDYKTGGRPQHVAEMGELFKPRKDRAKYIFQIFLYSCIMRRKHPGKKILPCLLYIHHASSPDYRQYIQFSADKHDVTEFTEDMERDFRAELRKLLDERIFNSEVPFTQTAERSECKHCDYRALCRRTADD